MQRIPAFDYRRALPAVEDEILNAVRRVLHSGQVILGPETTAFEQEFARAVQAQHCIGVTSGTTALHLALLALGVGRDDEVILPANTCAPTAAAVRLCGARPVLVDVRDSDLQIDPQGVAQAISARTRCIVAVHLWGLAADLDSLLAIADRAGIPLVEDCAQAMGTRLRGRHVGTFGRIGCYSFYPTKNLGAYGDAGAVVTNDAVLADAVRARRMYGYDANAVAQVDGLNGRISEIQAAVLRIKLRAFAGALAERIEIADQYRRGLESDAIHLPEPREGSEPSYHQFVIRCRDRRAVQRRLDECNIGWGIHYPTPLHKMPAFANCASPAGGLGVAERAAGEILSLPIFEGLTPEEVARVIDAVNDRASA